MRPRLMLVALALRLGVASPSGLEAGGARTRPTPKALLINLPRHEERFRDVKLQLDNAGLEYERAEAVDGKMLAPDELKANVTMWARWFITRGMIGCFLSHRYCWQRCIEAAAGPILGAHALLTRDPPSRARRPRVRPARLTARACARAVFEDDVVLADNFTEQLSAALDALPDDWDVCLLGALGAVHPSYYAVNLGHAMLAGGCRYPRGARKAFQDGEPDGGVAIHTPLRPFGTHAYALSERGAAKLLAAAPRANYHVDVVAWGLRSLNLFAVHPLLARQTHDDTTIGGHHDRSWLPEIVIDQCAPKGRPAPRAARAPPGRRSPCVCAPRDQIRARTLRGRGTRP